MDDMTTLKQVPLFGFMDDDEVRGIRAIMDLETYAPGQVIVRQGEPGDHFYIVTQGTVQFLTQDAGGNELTLDEIGAGGFFGELAMLTGEPRAARVRALDRVTTLTLDRDEFFAFLQQHPPAAIDVLRVLGQRLHRSDTLLRQSVSRNVNDLIDDKLTIGQRIADVISDFSGSIPFLIINIAFFGIWIGWNVIPSIAFDPFPFGLLTMIVSLEAIFLSIFLLISSNRQASKDRLVAEIDHEVNTKAEVEIGLVLKRLDDIERGIHHNHHEQIVALRKGREMEE